MKKIIISSLFFITSLSILAQKSPNSFLFKRKNYFTTKSSRERFNDISHFSLGLNYGFHGSLDALSSINPSSSDYFMMNARYFFNSHFGLSIKLGFDQFNAKNELPTLTNYADATLDLFFDLGKVLDFNSVNYDINKKSSKFQLFVHGGPGVATMWHKDFNISIANDPYFKNQDDIINLCIGIMPELKFSDIFSMNADFSITNNFLQDRNFNYSTENISHKSKVYSLIVGFNYFF